MNEFYLNYEQYSTIVQALKDTNEKSMNFMHAQMLQNLKTIISITGDSSIKVKVIIDEREMSVLRGLEL